jgi:hypothetical protein
VQCIPEHSNENLVSVVLQLSKVVSFPLNEKDIKLCSRVSKANRESTRLRSVILKLSLPRIRDSLIAACYKYNKANPSDRLNSSHLGLCGERKPIFESEHLSPINRSLPAQARIFKKENQFKYLWVRNGRILLRKDDSSPAIWIKGAETLQSLINI